VPHKVKCHTTQVVGATSTVSHRVLNTHVIYIVFNQAHYSCYLVHPQCISHSDPVLDALSNPTMIISGACVIWSLSRSDNDTRMSKSGWVLLEVRDPVWTTSDMRHWKEVIKITDDTDYYYCIIKVHCLPLAWYYFCVSVIKFLIFFFIGLYLHDWVMTLWSCTHVLVCARHLASFYVLIGLLYDYFGPACSDPRVRIRSVVDQSVEDQAFFAERPDLP